MQRYPLPLILLPILVSACGGATPAPEPPPVEQAAPLNSPANATPEDARSPADATPAPPAETSQREKDATKWLADMQSPDVDVAQRGVLATNGLSEEQFELPPNLRKAMEAVTSNRIDASQVSAILNAVLQEAPMSEVAGKLCGKPVRQVLDSIAKAPVADQAKTVVDQCSLGSVVDTTDLDKMSAQAVLLSAIVQDMLRARGASAAEIGLARLIAQLGRSDATP